MRFFASHPSSTGARSHHVRVMLGVSFEPAVLNNIFTSLTDHQAPSSLEQLGEDILEEIIEDIERVLGIRAGLPVELGEMEESIVSGASEPLPQSIGSAEELAKLLTAPGSQALPIPG